MKKNYRIIGICLAIAVTLPAPSFAWELKDIIGHLYTEDGVPGITLGGLDTSRTHDLEHELVVLNSQVGGELSSIRLNSGVASLGVEFDTETGFFVPTTSTFGPVYAERAQTIGARKLKFGVSYSRQEFKEFDGDDISGIEIILLTGTSVPPGFQSDLLVVDADFEIEEDVVAFSAIYGITDKLDVGIYVPFLSLDYDIDSHADIWGWDGSTLDVNGNPVLIKNPTPAQNPYHFFDSATGDSQDSKVWGDAEGIGDIIFRVKYHWLSARFADVGVLLDVQLPTGDEDRFLGTGDTNVTPSLILSNSFLNGRFNPHVNIGYEIDSGGSEESELVWSAGFDTKITEWLTGAVDVLGSNELDGDGVGDDIFDVSLGVKVSPLYLFQKEEEPSLVIFANVLLPLNDEGLRTDFTPTVGVEYTF